MFIVFSVIIHKNPFNSRFHLAIFIISTPLVGAVLTEWLAQRWVWMVAMLIYVSSWVWLFKCNEHPLIGDRSIFITTRSQQYFSTRPMLIYPYTQTAKLISSGTCRDIGLINDEDDMGYPWWILLRQNLGNKFRMEDVEIKNKSASLSYLKGPFDPCALIALNDKRTIITLSNSVYVRVWFMQLPDSMTSIFERAL